jgi:hypothetical protein
MRKAYIDLELESEINSDIHTVKIIYILDKDDEIPETISSYNIDTSNGITIINCGKYRYNIKTKELENPYYDKMFYNYHFLGIKEEYIPIKDKSLIKLGNGMNYVNVRLVLHKNYCIPNNMNFYINESNEIVIEVPGIFLSNGILKFRWVDTDRENIDKIISELVKEGY